MSVAPAIQRILGFADDAEPGGSEYDDLSSGGTLVPAPIPAPMYFWPGTGGTFDKGLTQIDRSAEVRGRRAISPRLPLHAAGVMTVPVPAYRSVLEKAFRKLLGGTDVVSGGGGEAQTHQLKVLGFNEGYLPCVHAQLVRDAYNLKASGGTFNKATLSFPLDGDGSCEFDIHFLYYAYFSAAAPTATFTGISSEPMMLRDCRAVLDGGGTAIPQPTALAVTAEGAGGALGVGAYKYTVVSVSATGLEGLPVAEMTVTPTAAQKVKVKWTAAAGAASYNVYRTKSGGATQTETLVGNTAGVELVDGASDASIASNKALPTEDQTQGIQIPDMTMFEFSFMNNVTPHWYAKRNVVTTSIGNPATTKKVWHPTEHRVSGAQDVGYKIGFANAEAAQEVAQEFGQIQKIIFEAVGVPLAVTPAATELLRITIYNAVHNPGAGASALAARGDTTTEMDGSGFYSAADGADIKVEVVNSSSTPLT